MGSRSDRSALPQAISKKTEPVPWLLCRRLSQQNRHKASFRDSAANGLCAGAGPAARLPGAVMPDGDDQPKSRTVREAVGQFQLWRPGLAAMIGEWARRLGSPSLLPA